MYKRQVFKGVNRHEFSSITGRVPNRDEVIKDIVTMKKNNINAIRTSPVSYTHLDVYKRQVHHGEISFTAQTSSSSGTVTHTLEHA